MATSHNINVILRGKGQTTTQTKTSATGSVERITTKNAGKRMIPPKLRKANDVLGGSSGLSMMKKAGIIGAMIYAGVQSANKVADVVMDIYSASTGEQLLVGNIKKARSYVMRPMTYLKDAFYTYGYLQPMITKRQNYANEYYRELSGKMIVGHQYGMKR